MIVRDLHESVVRDVIRDARSNKFERSLTRELHYVLETRLLSDSVRANMLAELARREETR